MKTATFIQSCCEVGGLVAKAPHEQVRALGEYGFHLGLAFQIADDLLDYRGDRAVTGKPQATDFREGCSTLPLIELLPALDGAESEFVAACFGNGVTDSQVLQIVAWMDSKGAFATVEREALEQARQGTASLAVLPDSPVRRLLESVAEFVVARNA
jgi:octaprenyl-diphosphate synthase